MQVCFHYGQEGHIQARCPFLIFGGVLDPTPLAWQLPNDRLETTEVPRTKG